MNLIIVSVRCKVYENPRPAGIFKSISYIYSADDTKLAKVGTDGVVTYAGSFVYTGSSLTYLQHPEGLYFPSSGGYHYFLKDHLSNTRLMVNTLGTGGIIVQQTDYYPFGMEIASYSSGVENRTVTTARSCKIIRSGLNFLIGTILKQDIMTQ